MKKLYPLKFLPVPKERVWGGQRLATSYGKPFDPEKTIGESWEISGFEEDSSIIANGFLAENSLYDVIETYMDEMVGDDHYKYFGNEFPLLIKLLDIQDRLSIQVHPDDITAFDRHNSYGKSEAWYVLEADPDACIYMGFNRDVNPNEFYERCKNETLEEVLNVYHPKKGDFFYIESGIIHSAGGGLVIAEVQQLSDITYRIYDWGREHNPATAREMHLELAFDCINYSKYDPAKYFIPAERGVGEIRKGTDGIRNGADGQCNTGHEHNCEERHCDENHCVDDNCHEHHCDELHHGPLTSNPHFTISLLELKDALHIYPEQYQSFILYFCVSGEGVVSRELPSVGGAACAFIGASAQSSHGASASVPLRFSKGEWVLIPASLPDFYLYSPIPAQTKVLEIYIEKPEEKDSYIDEDCDCDGDCGHHHKH